MPDYEGLEAQIWLETHLPDYVGHKVIADGDNLRVEINIGIDPYKIGAIVPRGSLQQFQVAMRRSLQRLSESIAPFASNTLWREEPSEIDSRIAKLKGYYVTIMRDYAAIAAAALTASPAPAERYALVVPGIAWPTGISRSDRSAWANIPRWSEDIQAANALKSDFRKLAFDEVLDTQKFFGATEKEQARYIATRWLWQKHGEQMDKLPLLMPPFLFSYKGE